MYFEAKKKAAVVFVNLTAICDTFWQRGLTCKLLRLLPKHQKSVWTCDTVWHRGLTYKLLRILPDKHMIRMIIKLVQNRSFTLTTRDSKQSRLRRLKRAFLRDRSWLRTFSTSICTACLTRFPES